MKISDTQNVNHDTCSATDYSVCQLRHDMIKKDQLSTSESESNEFDIDIDEFLQCCDDTKFFKSHEKVELSSDYENAMLTDFDSIDLQMKINRAKSESTSN